MKSEFSPKSEGIYRPSMTVLLFWVYCCLIWKKKNGILLKGNILKVLLEKKCLILLTDKSSNKNILKRTRLIRTDEMSWIDEAYTSSQISMIKVFQNSELKLIRLKWHSVTDLSIISILRKGKGLW